MCFMPKAPDPVVPAAAPALPEKSPTQQDIGGGRQAENRKNFGQAGGPVLRRASAKAGPAAPTTGSGVRM